MLVVIMMSITVVAAWVIGVYMGRPNTAKLEQTLVDFRNAGYREGYNQGLKDQARRLFSLDDEAPTVKTRRYGN